MSSPASPPAVDDGGSLLWMGMARAEGGHELAESLRAVWDAEVRPRHVVVVAEIARRRPLLLHVGETELANGELGQSRLVHHRHLTRKKYES